MPESVGEKDGLTYEELVAHSLRLDFAGRPLQVLSLEVIVRNKRRSPHNKDKLALAVLEETLRQTKF